MNGDRKGGLRGNDVKEGEGKRKARVLRIKELSDRVDKNIFVGQDK